MADTNTTVPTVYLVTDMRTVKQGDSYAAPTNTTQHRTRQKADARYYDALANAAKMEGVISAGAYMMTNEGFLIDSKVLYFGQEPTPEQEPEVAEGE